LVQGELEQAKPPHEGVDQILGVAGFRKYRDPGPRRAAVSQKHLFRQEPRCRHSSDCEAGRADHCSPPIEFDHPRTSKTLSPSAACSANAHTARVEMSFVPA